MQRFQFQRDCVAKVSGNVLNAGCKEDPAHLKSQFGNRIVNLDRSEIDDDQWNNHGQRVPIPVDVVHDMTVFPWPFADQSFDLVVLGDILEDLPDDGCQEAILREVHRIARHVCITTPQDGPERDAHHQTRITQDRLRSWLALAEFVCEDFQTVDYGFVPEGYFVFATRVVTGNA